MQFVRGLCALLAPLLLFGCGRIHTLKDGHYAIVSNSVVRDDCNLASAPGYVSGGRLVTTGDELHFDYDAFGIQLAGSYLDPVLGAPDKMALDGTAANVDVNIGGNDCLLTLLTLHLDATTVDAHDFKGNLSVKTDITRPETCLCQLWVTYDAHAQ